MSILVLVTSEAEAAPLVRWGLRFAAAHETDVKILASRSGRDEADEEVDWRAVAAALASEGADVEGECDPIVRAVVERLMQSPLLAPASLEAEGEGGADGEAGGEPTLGGAIPDAEMDEEEEAIKGMVKTVEVRRFVHADPYPALTALAEREMPQVLLLAKHHASDTGKAQDHLFEHVHCATLLVRLGDHSGEQSNRVLIPAVGGPDSLAALRLFRRVVERTEMELTPLYVARSTGEIAEDVGRRILRKILRKVDLEDHPRVTPKVVKAKNFTRGLALVAEAQDYDLVVIGQAGANRVKKTLFGILPESALRGQDSTAIGVMKRAKPIRERLRTRAEGLITDWVPQLGREQRIDLFARLETQSRWSFDFVSLLSLSTLIAGLGLVTNSAAVVIGAMLVAPLMVPILGAGLALMQGNLPLMKQSMKAVCLGFMAAFFIGVLIGLFVPIPDFLTPELNARGNPSVLDIFIALASGVAAAYAMGRPDLSAALPGVAIAAALVPPIATSGIAFAEGVWGVAAQSSLLFLTNVITIILSASLTLYLTGVRMKKGSSWSLAVLGLLCVLTVLLALTLGMPEFGPPPVD